jgi:glyoxylase-like metal-dependent hydrolase (beta-lactamase superfamily II)
MTDELVRLTDNLWFFPPDPAPRRMQPAIGVIITERGTILVDAGNGQPHARRLLRALQAIAAPPVRYIIYTHHHWDHVFGAQVFDAPAIAHHLCRAKLLNHAQRPWSYAYLEEEMRRSPALEPIYQPMQFAVDEWQTFRVVVPGIAFDKHLTLHSGAVPIVLAHIGGKHAPDSLTVRVGDVLFLGDCIYPPRPLWESCAECDHALIARFLDDESIRLYVPAHTPTPCTRAEFAALLA